MAFSKREAWQFFRELVKPKWSEAFINSVETATGTREFTYVLAVTVIIGDRRNWENHRPFIEAIGGKRRGARRILSTVGPQTKRAVSFLEDRP